MGNDIYGIIITRLPFQSELSERHGTRHIRFQEVFDPEVFDKLDVIFYLKDPFIRRFSPDDIPGVFPCLWKALVAFVFYDPRDTIR